MLRDQGNILPDSSAAPGLQAQQRDLQKHMRKDSLEKQLQRRPDPEQLVREGILNGECTSSLDSEGVLIKRVADENPLNDV